MCLTVLTLPHYAYIVQVSFHAMNAAETLAKMCPDVTKLTAPVYLQPSDLGPATMSKYFVRRWV